MGTIVEEDEFAATIGAIPVVSVSRARGNQGEKNVQMK